MSTVVSHRPESNLKDALIFVPFVASAFAVSYEIGTFIPLGRAFALFSLTEHLLFAFEAVPIAVALAVLLFIASAITGPIWEVLRQKDSGRKLRLRFRWLIGWLLLVALAEIALGLTERRAIHIALGFALLVFAGGAASPQRILFRSRISIPLAISLALLVTMALGFDRIRTILNISLPADFIIGGNIKKAVYVRSGERGLLIFDQTLNEFSFEKWDEVKKISWIRGPARRQLYCMTPFWC